MFVTIQILEEKIVKPVIKWSGSKRSQSSKIKSYLPTSFGTYYEPFVGGGSILYTVCPTRSICGDICQPLIKLWKEIRDNPQELAESYKLRWNELQNEGYLFYYAVRDKFNKDRSPYDLLFLSRTCVNGLIRFNDKGEFNNSFHHSRSGINPNTLKEIIFDWSSKIQGVEFLAEDYVSTTSSAKSNDVIYLDPPYFHTKGRYFGTICFEKFLDYLENLNSRGIKFLLSFDGRRGDEDYTVKLPMELYKRHEYILSGNSTFKKVIDKECKPVLESLYLNY